jgi:WD domain, G-beta repeat.
VIEEQYEGVFEGHTSAVNAILVTKDKKFVITGSDDHTVRIWNLIDKRQESVLEGHTS